MDMLLTGKSIFVICFVIYIGVWVLLVLRYYLYTRRPVEQIDVNRLRQLHRKPMLHRYLGWIWVLPLGIFMKSLFPNVEIVRYEPEPISLSIWDDKETEDFERGLFGNENDYFIESYYVPFFYRGQFCRPFNSYVFNETDSLMAIYQAKTNDGYLYSSDNPPEFTPPEFTLVKPAEMIMIPHRKSSFYFKFESPWDGDVIKGELAINLYGKALWDTEYSQKVREERREQLYRRLSPRGKTERESVKSTLDEVVIYGKAPKKITDSVPLDDKWFEDGMIEFNSYGE